MKKESGVRSQETGGKRVDVRRNDTKNTPYFRFSVKIDARKDLTTIII
ncbi:MULTISPECIES: hypothetical protein [Okeania]|nr:MULTISPECIES: hypothetical protein [Okeania]NET20150.1 hypothetical protein [Okeania sp. SIO1H5]NET76803.1 hypothetical protein [Okeania sp. SIO1F9]NET92160.1 hypothetical protein [Okeania sp. SIO1H2]